MRSLGGADYAGHRRRDRRGAPRGPGALGRIEGEQTTYSSDRGVSRRTMRTSVVVAARGGVRAKPEAIAARLKSGGEAPRPSPA